eukprot:TRINITY_DN1514_c0_g1_i1.p1 TRINITY_DN1514_c0_g1~~TRINITY_DN1514_c0_g1_i1.p1  ORF type:complete len:255 (+),score=30.16 TRINITY_DN1514_c0_g1_i1:87-851(+)
MTSNKYYQDEIELELLSKYFEPNDTQIEIEHGDLLYTTSFNQQGNQYISYRTWTWVFICLCLIPVYGVGLLCLLYTPVLKYIVRSDIERRIMYITSESVVYKTSVPVHCVPCCGSHITERHVLLPLITDVVVSQGCCEKRWGLYTVQLENAGQARGKGSTADVSVTGLDDYKQFKRVVLCAATAHRAGLRITQEDVARLLLPASKTPLTYYQDILAANKKVTMSDPRIIESIRNTNDTLDKLTDILISDPGSIV